MPKKSTLGLKPVYADSGELVKIVLHEGKFADENFQREWLAPELSTLPEEIATRISGYGLAKIMMDRASQVPMGTGKLDSFEATLLRFEQGEWAAERQGGIGMVSVFVEAIAALKGITIPQAQKTLKAYTDEDKDKMKANEAVKAKMAEIEAERAQGEEDIDLSELI